MKRKCSKHQSSEVVTYYPECKKFCCSECDKLMRELFPEYHSLPIDEVSELTLTFNDRCGEIGHSDCPLNYFCRAHSELCCSECAYSEHGKHRSCKVVRIKDIESEYKGRLSASVDALSAEVERIEADMKRSDGVASTFSDRQARASEAKSEAERAINEVFERYKEAIDKRRGALVGELEKRYRERINYDDLASKAQDCLCRARALHSEQRKALAMWSPARLAEMIQDTLEVERDLAKLRECWERLVDDTALEPRVNFLPEKRVFDDMIAKVATIGSLTVSLEKSKTLQSPPQQQQQSQSQMLQSQDSGMISRRSSSSKVSEMTLESTQPKQSLQKTSEFSKEKKKEKRKDKDKDKEREKDKERNNDNDNDNDNDNEKEKENEGEKERERAAEKEKGMRMGMELEVPRRRKMKQSYTFRWALPLDSTYSLSGSGLVITKTRGVSSDGNNSSDAQREEFIVVRGDTPIPSGAGTVRWGVRVLRSKKNNGGFINVGVAPTGEPPVRGSKLVFWGWYYYCSGSKLYSGPPHSISGKEYGPRNNGEPYVCNGTTVWVTMDTNTGNVSFSLNDEGPLDTSAPAFEGIPMDKPLVPSVGLRHEDDSLEAVF